jgi:hypothetical protein
VRTSSDAEDPPPVVSDPAPVVSSSEEQAASTPPTPSRPTPSTNWRRVGAGVVDALFDGGLVLIGRDIGGSSSQRAREARMRTGGFLAGS